MNERIVTARDQGYPERLTALLGPEAPAALSCAGNEELLGMHSLALLCSRQCPGSMILQTYEFIQKLRRRNIAVIGGFHSPMEKECLRALMSGVTGIVWCLAKTLDRFKVPDEFKALADAGRLLLLSPFPATVTRITAETAAVRNRVAAALADEVFLPHAAAGSSTETFCLELLAWEKPVLTLAAEENRGILERGAQAVGTTDIDTLWPGEPAPPQHGDLGSEQEEPET